MKKYGKLIIILGIVFASLFLINATVMYSLFGINVLRASCVDNGSKRVDDESKIQRSHAGELTNDEFVAEQEERDLREKTGFTGDSSRRYDGRSVPEGYYMTADEVEFLKQRLGLRDKISAMVIISRMEKDVIDEIYSMSQDGVTMDEFEIISGTIEEHLSASELDKLLDILSKSKMLYAESRR